MDLPACNWEGRRQEWFLATSYSGTRPPSIAKAGDRRYFLSSRYIRYLSAFDQQCLIF